MRGIPLAWILVVGLMPGCADESSEGSGGGNSDESESSEGDGTDSAGSNGGQESGDGTGGGSCVPGASVECTCTDGEKGAQLCNDDGASFGPCECSDPSTGSGADATGSTSDSGTTTSESGDTTSAGSSSTTGASTTGGPGTTTGAGTTGAGGTTGTTGGVADPYGSCESLFDCQDGGLCNQFMDMGTSYDVCQPGCFSPTMCPDPMGGTAIKTCTLTGRCELDCSMGRTCPAGMVCANMLFDDLCAWPP